MGWLIILTYHMLRIQSWNPRQPFINGCFNWIISNCYIGNGWKSPNIHFKLVVNVVPGWAYGFRIEGRRWSADRSTLPTDHWRSCNGPESHWLSMANTKNNGKMMFCVPTYTLYEMKHIVWAVVFSRFPVIGMNLFWDFTILRLVQWHLHVLTNTIIIIIIIIIIRWAPWLLLNLSHRQKFVVVAPRFFVGSRWTNQLGDSLR